MNNIGLYVHIPFCETKCPYCDFNTYAKIESLIPEYVAAVNTEIGIWGRLLDEPKLSTVFFGGGTPSYLPTHYMASIIETVHESFDLSADAELTLEANPGDLTDVNLMKYLDVGLNRLSIGVQSLDDRLLKLLGRRHSASEAIQAIRMATEAGFDNVSIDLMYGLPQQNLNDWSRTLGSVREINIQHISMYCLTLEGATPMEQQVASGQLPEPDPDLAADMYLMAENIMDSRGFGHYEISNWALPGMESRHNLRYWKNQPYLGVGPGAHSYLFSERFHNIRSPREYVKLLSEQSPESIHQDDLSTVKIDLIPTVEMSETIDQRLELAETMMLGLRLNSGVTIEDITRRFGITPASVYGNTLTELESLGLVDTTGGAIKLTSRGRLLGNEVFTRFLH